MDNKNTIRVYIPVDVTLPTEHIDMVMGDPGWKESFYEFESAESFVMYAARLMLFNLLGQQISGLSCLTKFDGHCVDEHKGKFSLIIPEDDGWSIEDASAWAEESH